MWEDCGGQPSARRDLSGTTFGGCVGGSFHTFVWLVGTESSDDAVEHMPFTHIHPESQDALKSLKAWHCSSSFQQEEIWMEAGSF